VSSEGKPEECIGYDDYIGMNFNQHSVVNS
jgi:hypothetical protein